MNDKSGFDRRMFLKASSLAALGATLDPKTQAEQTAAEHASTKTSASRREAQDAKASIDLVNVMQGVDSTYLFSRGNTLPIAAVPFGMAHWTLQSTSNTPWMIRPGDRRLQGFRCTHQLSPWLSDYGQAIFMPVCGSAKPQSGPRSSSWIPEKAKLRPYSFNVPLTQYQMDAELVPTERCALIVARTRDDKSAGFIIEVPGKNIAIHADKATRTVRFSTSTNAGGVPDNFASYYVIRFQDEWDTIDLHTEEKSQLASLSFAKKKVIEARIATSFISFEQAERNLSNEVGNKSIDEIRNESKTRWNELFHRMEVEGGDKRQKTIFYSCLYRALLFPRVWHEPDANGKFYHYSPYNGKIEPGVMYADHGYWDVYRAWYPFMAVVYPDRLADILQAWVNAYKEGGWLPQFPAPGYRACMTGSLIDAVFGDAAAKGIQGYDIAGAYEGLKKHATQPGFPDKGYGRRGVEDYLRLGYMSMENVDQPVAETVDAAYGDFCISQVAKALNKQEDVAMFVKRSENWRHLFDSQTGFLRGKHENGSWLAPFDPIAWGNPYVEGSAWQHRWDVQHDIPGLIEAMGGKKRAVEALNEMMSMPAIFHVGSYEQEIHEMSEMAAVDFGQYAHSNQPSHHLLYIFAMAGRPDKTQHWVRRTLEELYTPDSFAGDEDTGSMAAWYLFSSMGFYSLTPGKAEYVLGAPLFDRITLNLPSGKKVVVEAKGQSASAMYAAKIFVNGKEHTSPLISHKEIVEGGQLTFYMTDKPSV